MEEDILIPAGLNSTSLDDNILPLKNKEPGYYSLADSYVNEPYIYVPNVKGAASIFPTAHDLYLWDRILQPTLQRAKNANTQPTHPSGRNYYHLQLNHQQPYFHQFHLTITAKQSIQHGNRIALFILYMTTPN